MQQAQPGRQAAAASAFARRPRRKAFHSCTLATSTLPTDRAKFTAARTSTYLTYDIDFFVSRHSRTIRSILVHEWFSILFTSVLVFSLLSSTSRPVRKNNLLPRHIFCFRGLPRRTKKFRFLSHTFCEPRSSCARAQEKPRLFGAPAQGSYSRS